MSGPVAHRTTTSIAPERQKGRRLTERYMHRGHCLCGWVGETHPTWALAKEDAALHRRSAGVVPRGTRGSEEHA